MAQRVGRATTDGHRCRIDQSLLVTSDRCCSEADGAAQLVATVRFQASLIGVRNCCRDPEFLVLDQKPTMIGQKR